MSKTAVVYWSATGNTEQMAKAVAEGAKAAGSECSLFPANDFDTSSAERWDALALGCPSMGVEELEPETFLPMFEEIEGKLRQKKVALFGSYGWGDGEWMRNWERRCKDAGMNVDERFVICCGEPDDEAIAACKAIGSRLA